MQIDWITVSAQIVNFLVLVWLLKRFLYQPVIRAMDGRERHIAERLNEATLREQQANEQRQQFENKSDKLLEEREEIIQRTIKEVEQEKKQMLDLAREDVNELRANWQRQIEEEKGEFLSNLRRQATEIIQAQTRKVLDDLADVRLEEQIIQMFIERLETLDKDSRDALIDTGESLVITTTFDLDPALRGHVTRSIHEHFVDSLDIEYRRSPDLLCGVELSNSSQRLSWNMADYIDELVTRVDECFTPVRSEH